MTKTLLSVFIFLCIGCFSFAQTFSTAQIIDADPGNDPYEIASGDLDGDGDMDLVMATYVITAGNPLEDYIKWYKNDGIGNFTTEATVSSTIRSVDGLIIADIDGQHGNDIVATSVIQNKLVYYLSNSSGGFDSEVVVDDALTGAGNVVSGDINMDGFVDLVAMTYDGNATFWYSNDGTGNFTKQARIEPSIIEAPYYVTVADFDGDTDIDVAVGYFSNNQSIELFYNQFIETGSVSWIKDVNTIDSGNSFLFVIEAGDVDNDGIAEILKVDNSSGEVAWYDVTKDVSSIENIISSKSIIARPGAVKVADINNDDLNDVIVSNANSGSANPAIAMFAGASNSNPGTTPNVLVTTSKQFYDITIADLDGDTVLDIATVGRGTDTVDWFENQSTLSIKGQGFNDLKMYPNPTSNRLYLKGSIAEVLEITVFDTLGKAVLTKDLSTNESLDVSQLNQGIYFLKFKNHTDTFKFVKS